MFLKPFVKELGRNLNRQYITFVSKGCDRLKPSVEVLLVHLLSNYFEAIVPSGSRVNFHAIEAKYSEFYDPALGKGNKGVKIDEQKTNVHPDFFKKFFTPDL